MDYNEVLERVKLISPDNKQLFDYQENMQDILDITVKQTGCLYYNIPKGSYLTACEYYTMLVYAVVIKDGEFFCSLREEKNLLPVFTNKKRAEKFCAEKGGELYYVRFDDLLALIDVTKAGCVQVCFEISTIEIDSDYITNILSVNFYNNINETSNYEISNLAGYEKVKQKFCDAASKYDMINKLYFAHVKEYKDMSEYAENGNYTPEYTVIVVDMPYSYFIDMRDSIIALFYTMRNECPKVVLHESDLAKKVIEAGIEPIYEKK